jgi:hypothetical protein
MYLIITTRTIYHEGDERSRQFPGHGYPAYSEDVQRLEEFEDYTKFAEKVKSYLKDKTPIKIYEAKQLKASLTVEVVMGE